MRFGNVLVLTKQFSNEKNIFQMKHYSHWPEDGCKN